MANWREQTLDKAITMVRNRGFNDPDFEGWEDIPADQRKQVIRTIIDNNGVASIVFRASFAAAMWGTRPACEHGWSVTCLKPHKRPGFVGAAHDMHRQQMVIAQSAISDQDGWLSYLRENIA